MAKRQLCMRQSDWNGEVGTPKGGRLRYVPLTRRLAATLADHRHLKSKRVRCQDSWGADQNFGNLGETAMSAEAKANG